jgi:hypothetical protein
MTIIKFILKGFAITAGVTILLIVCISLLIGAAMPTDEEVEETINDIEAQVTDDAVAQYYLVVENGGAAVDRCAQAGLVAAAFLQSNDATGYAEWLEVRKRDCAAAGISY